MLKERMLDSGKSDEIYFKLDFCHVTKGIRYTTMKPKVENSMYEYDKPNLACRNRQVYMKLKAIDIINGYLSQSRLSEYIHMYFFYVITGSRQRVSVYTTELRPWLYSHTAAGGRQTTDVGGVRHVHRNQHRRHYYLPSCKRLWRIGREQAMQLTHGSTQHFGYTVGSACN